MTHALRSAHDADHGGRVEPLLSVRGLSKAYAGVQALADVSLAVHAGEIVALVGPNGSGKSTLVKALAGVVKADAGTIAAPDLRFIHQDLGLVGLLSTVENLALGAARPGASTPARRREERRKARELLRGFDLDVDVDAPVATLSSEERAIIAIARALDGWSGRHGVLVLDEPTAALHRDGVARLMAAVRNVAARGAGVVFISHRLDEVLDLADRVVVLRNGGLVTDQRRSEIDHDRLIEMIVGQSLGRLRLQHAVRDTERPVLRLRGLRGLTVRGVDLDVRPGEVVGVSGVLGSGREHLNALAFGALWRDGGAVEARDRRLRPGDLRSAIDAGLAFVPADRHAEGAVMSLTARENLLLGDDGSRRGPRAEPAERWFDAVDLHPREPGRRLSLFSGGNQQKVVLARWLRRSPACLLLDEPTQGVDVGAKAAIYGLIDQAAADGAGVVMASSDNQELVAVCDRVVVMRDGLIGSEVPRAGLSEERLVREGLVPLEPSVDAGSGGAHA